ncbi:MAG TPA: hypothetical protein VLT33_25280 [Labilithrix sp.]|nr:hypothetical protein [Labilithrix sp.]
MMIGVLGVCAVAAVAANGCGGRSVETSPTGDASSADASTGGRPPGCPDADPQGGTSCTKEGLLCEYGDDYNPLCNVTRVCSSGRWAQPIQSGGKRSCPSTRPVIPPNPADCAADVASLPAGACSSKSTCNYEGAVCTCGAYCPSYPVSRPPCDPDAGTTTNCCDTTKVEWHCFEGPKYCATPRPRIGAACTTEGESCAIDEPVECGQTVMRCSKGIWDLGNTQCPISTARAKRDITYVDGEQTDRLHGELMNVRLATYRYKVGDEATHLGFIIEDMPPASPAVLPARDRVDLYGYVSMSVASLQHQQQEIDRLSAEMARVSAENAALRREIKKGGR